MRTNTARYTAATTAALTGVAAGVLGVTTTATAASTALPAVSKLSQSAISSAAAAVSTVVVTGKNFTGTTGITLSPAATGAGTLTPTFQVISDTQLVVTFTTTVGALTPAAGSQLIVTNPKGASANTLKDNLSLLLPVDAAGATVAAGTLLNPFGKSVISMSGLAAGLGTTAALFGAKKITATVDGEAAPVKWASDTSVTITAPAGVPSNTAPNVVLYKEGVAGTANTVAKYAAVVSRLSVTSGPVAGGGTVVVTGKGFAAGGTWKFGTVAATCTGASDVTVSCTVPAAAAAAAGAVSVNFVPAASTTYGTTTGATYTYTDRKSVV